MSCNSVERLILPSDVNTSEEEGCASRDGKLISLFKAKGLLSTLGCMFLTLYSVYCSQSVRKNENHTVAVAESPTKTCSEKAT